MKKDFTLDELKKYIEENKFDNGDRIYCKEYPNLIFIFEKNNENQSINNFIAYYFEGQDLYSDGPLNEILQMNKEYFFSVEPFIN